MHIPFTYNHTFMCIPFGIETENDVHTVHTSVLILGWVFEEKKNSEQKGTKIQRVFQ